MKRKNLNINNLLRLYNSGESEKALAKRLQVSRAVIRRRLLESNVTPRNRSAAMYARMARTSSKERARLATAAHDAVRGKRQPFEQLCKRAKSMESRGTGITRIEIICINALRKQGFNCVPQKAIGAYNIDIAITEPPIAVEIFGGHWHTTGRHSANFRKRTDYILNAGWLPIIIWVTKDYPLEIGAIDYIVSTAKQIRSGKTVRREEKMIRGDGQFTSVGIFKLNGLPNIFRSQPRDKTTGRYTFRFR